MQLIINDQKHRRIRSCKVVAPIIWTLLLINNSARTKQIKLEYLLKYHFSYCKYFFTLASQHSNEYANLKIVYTCLIPLLCPHKCTNLFVSSIRLKVTLLTYSSRLLELLLVNKLNETFKTTQCSIVCIRLHVRRTVR